MTAWAASRPLHFDTTRVNADPYGEALPGDLCDLLGDVLPGQAAGAGGDATASKVMSGLSALPGARSDDTRWMIHSWSASTGKGWFHDAGDRP
jgi:hypothetical protein